TGCCAGATAVVDWAWARTAWGDRRSASRAVPTDTAARATATTMRGALRSARKKPAMNRTTPAAVTTTATNLALPLRDTTYQPPTTMSRRPVSVTTRPRELL